jgi:hypothetical protein
MRALLPAAAGYAWISVGRGMHHEIVGTAMGRLGARSTGACNHHLHRDAARFNQAGHRAVGRWLRRRGNDGGTDYIGGALLAFRALGHCSIQILQGRAYAFQEALKFGNGRPLS